MARRKPRQQFEFDTIHLDPSASDSQYRQLENQIRAAISTGLLPAGARVPSTRMLSETLNVSRNTVLSAYQQLISEGYLESETGAGTKVAELLPEAFEPSTTTPASFKTDDPTKHLSQNGRKLAGFADWISNTSEQFVPFRPHLPAIDEFPTAVWNRLTYEQMKWSNQQLHQCSPQGYLPLRESLAEYMGVSRGVSCTAEQIVITAGAQQGLSLILQLIIDSGDTVWVEEPGNAPANQMMEMSGCQVVPLPLDGEGMDLSAMSGPTASPKLIYVTPGSQWPMTMTMSLNRRLQLLSTAEQHQSWVIEDDYNSEYRYSGRPHPALCSLDSSGRTIYMGTLSKMLFPAIRLGFLVVPPQLAPALAYARWLNDRFSPPLPQMVLHRFIESGQFLKHIRQMRSLYRERQTLLHQLLLKNLSQHITIERPESGMHLVVKGVTRGTENELMKAARLANVEFHTVAMYSQNPKSARGLILGFAAYNNDDASQAVKAWAKEFANL